MHAHSQWVCIFSVAYRQTHLRNRINFCFDIFAHIFPCLITLIPEALPDDNVSSSLNSTRFPLHSLTGGFIICFYSWIIRLLKYHTPFLGDGFWPHCKCSFIDSRITAASITINQSHGWSLQPFWPNSLVWKQFGLFYTFPNKSELDLAIHKIACQVNATNSQVTR